MELAGILLRKRIALALHRVDVDQHRSVLLLRPLQHVAQAGQVVAVNGPQIGEAHVLEQGTAGPESFFQGRLDPVVEAVQAVLHRPLAKETPIPLFEMVVGRLAAQATQMGGHGPHVGVDGHAVVVENDDQRLPGGPGVVEALVGQAAGQGAVADKGQDAVILALQGPGSGHAQRHGHRVGGMARDESVVLALVGLGEAGQAVQLPQGGELLLTPRQGLVDVALVAHVEPQPVRGGVEHPVDGHSQLHGPQVGSQMAAGPGYIFDQKLPQLLTQLGQLGLVQRLDVSGRVDGFQ